MTQKNLEQFVVSRTDTIKDAMLKITANRLRAVVVLDGRRVVGLVSDGDIRRAFLKEVLPIAPVEDIMNVNCETTTETDPRKLQALISQKRVTILPIVGPNNELVDIAVGYEPFSTGAVG